MTYLADYAPKRCQVPGCRKPAKSELIDYQNRSRGFYCKRHGLEACSKRAAFEAAYLVRR
jgi:hypothetical protein